jgi:dimethylglycine dehydrogenase
MAKGARDQGAEIIRQNPVEAIERTPSGEWLLRTRKGDIRAEIIVNAAGTWCQEIGEMMGLDLPVDPIHHQYLVMDRVRTVAERIAAGQPELRMIRDPEESWYVRQERDGLIVGPYEKQATPWSVDGVPPDFGMELLPPELDRVEDIVACAMERLPVLAEAGIKTIVNGPITFTPDANPLIGPAFGLPNAFLLTGSSMGVMEGGGAGKFLAEWIVDGAPPMDALAIDPRRFGDYADRDYRIDKAVECFGLQFGIHYPFEERPAGRPRRLSPAYDRMAARGAVFGAAYGWERPNWFAPEGQGGEVPLTFHRPAWFGAVGAECRAVRDRAGIADLSAFSKYELRGPGALAFLEGLGANRPPRRDGGVGLLQVLTPAGGVASEFTVTRLSAERFYLVSAAAAERHDLDLLTARSRGADGVTVENLTTARGVLAVAGPHARDILSQVTDADLGNAAFPWLTAREIEAAGVRALALRVSYVGELGWELHHELADQAPLFDALVAAGEAYGLAPFGAYAMNALRLEKGYRAWGMDLSTERTPLEAGFAPFVKTDGRDFVGRDSMLARTASGEAWRMTLLEIVTADADPFAGHAVMAGETLVGLVTSGAYGHRVDKALALAYLDPRALAAAGSERLFVVILEDPRPARILEKAPYDPDNARMRA